VLPTEKPLYCVSPHYMPQTRRIPASWSECAARGWAPVFGDPNAYLSLVHADDAAGAVIAALNAPPGTYNVAEAAPVRLLRLAGGEFAGLLMRSQRVSNLSLRRRAAWQPVGSGVLNARPRLVEAVLASDIGG
jgi:nucleoside-diphosphate-sugar epimerase